MSHQSRPMSIAVVAGEESGDLLGADLISALAAASGRTPVLTGVGGERLQALGLTPVFDPSEIALMGATAILKALPRLVRRIDQAARAIIAARPDCLVTVDSPEFGLRVARKVRAADPSIPIVHYVCPSVWAWRPGRAAAMRSFVDHVLCVLPFEPDELRRLGGPAGSYVGHRLVHEPGVALAAGMQKARSQTDAGDRTLLVLPGSRRSEVRGLMAPFGQTVGELKRRGNRFRLLLPTVRHVAELVARESANWDQKPQILTDPAAKWQAFGQADAALAASGTVSLELALCGVPFASCYKADILMRLASGLITVWSGSLPNLIADRPIVPEFYDRFIRPSHLARTMEMLMERGAARSAQLQGFELVAAKMETERPAGERAASIIADLARRPA